MEKSNNKVKFKARYNFEEMRRNAIVFLCCAVACLGAGIVSFIYFHYYEYLIVFGLLSCGLVYISVNHFLKLGGDTVFEVTEKAIILKKKKGDITYEFKNIKGIGGSVNLGRRAKEFNGNTLEQIANASPLEKIKGDFVIVLEDKEVKFSALENIFELFESVYQSVPEHRLTIWLGKDRKDYKFWKDEQGSDQTKN